jgi:hypothetical protein
MKFTPQPLHPRVKSHLYPLDGRLGRPQSRYKFDREEKNPCPWRKSNSGRPARSLVTIMTEVSRVHSYSLETVVKYMRQPVALSVLITQMQPFECHVVRKKLSE